MKPVENLGLLIFVSFFCLCVSLGVCVCVFSFFPVYVVITVLLPLNFSIYIVFQCLPHLHAHTHPPFNKMQAHSRWRDSMRCDGDGDAVVTLTHIFIRKCQWAVFMSRCAYVPFFHSLSFDSCYLCVYLDFIKIRFHVRTSDSSTATSISSTISCLQISYT